MIGNSLDKCDLSVIIITRNEEELVEDCIKSVLSALKLARDNGVIESSEVIHVDSASTDGTIELAKKYPINILQLDPSCPLSAGAGLYIGFLHAKKRYLGIVAGDMTIDTKWFTNALPHLDDENIAGVTGVYVEELNGTNMTSKSFIESSKDQPPGEVEVIASGIFKKDVLEEVGAYNPYLKAAEDKDLSWKITEKGYKLVRLPYIECHHFCSGRDKKVTFIQYLKKMFDYSFGSGQAARYSIRNKKMFWKFLSQYVNIYFAKIYILLLLSFSFILANLLNFMMKSTNIMSYAIIVIDILLAIFGAFIALVRYKGEKWNEFIFSFHVIPYMFTRELGFILGFFKKPRDPSSYPVRVKKIK